MRRLPSLSMINHSETNRALSQIPDEGLFERLATSVLRQALPALYGNLIHTGMNPDGKTVKSPIDGIAFIPGSNPPHMVIAHHTSGAVDTLKKKWLHDPSTAVPRKKSKYAVSPGDVIKTMGIVEKERKRIPNLQVTLALTTNREPPGGLVCDIEAAAINYGITIDIWSGSRIAHYLDNEPDGQWLRKTFLGIEQLRLSKQLLRQLSLDSLKNFPLMAQKGSLVERELDRDLTERSPRPVTFLIGESGLGKTIACYKYLKAHIEADGYSLILTQEVLAAYRTLDLALDAELRKLHPCLEPDAGAKARALCSPDKPFLILIEDVNKSDHPALLLERLAGWATIQNKNDHIEVFAWHILCPVWPKVLAMTSDEARKRIEALSILAAPFTAEEACAAAERSAALTNVTVSALEASSIASALGNDPLLIALYDFAKKSEPQQVLGDFVNNSLNRLSGERDGFTLTEYRTALKALACGMLLHHRVEPAWPEIQEWLKSQPNHLNAIRRIVQDRYIMRLTHAYQVERLLFRHDRVRAWLLSETIAELMQTDRLEDTWLSEPFFADMIGTALCSPNIPIKTVTRICISNPLALFYALKTFREPSTEIHHTILHGINAWLGTAETHGRANRALRWAVLQVLSEIESSCVLPITSQFREQPWAALEARFRNGDVSAGLQLCLIAEPGTGAPWRDRQIAHAKIRFKAYLIHVLDELLKRPDLSGSERSGALRLAGHLSESSLADGIAASWTSDPEKIERLADYLWAAAQCCGDDPEQLLKPVCDAWAALPNEDPKDGQRSPRNDLAADHISWAFRDTPPVYALGYFVERAKGEDLHGPIIDMVRCVDHPDTVEFIAREFAAFYRGSAETERFWPFPGFVHSDWKRQQREKGKRMSLASRERLQGLWASTDNDEHLRRQAFLLWAATSAPDDVNLLQTVGDIEPIANEVLRARLERGDRTAIPALIHKIENDKTGYWWQLGRSIWSEDLTDALDEALKRRSDSVEHTWNTEFVSDWITSELLIRLKPAVAERLIVKHWEHLQFSSYFVQSALYIATSKSCALAKEAISQCPDASKILEHIDSNFGIKMAGHPGVDRIEQIQALVPYLDHIAPIDIHSLWNLCNEQGWLDFRHAYLDERLQGQWRDITLLDKSKFFSELNEQVAKGRIFWIDYWIDRFLGQGEQFDKILRLLCEWLHEHRTIPALEIVAAAIVHAGKRSDLNLLCVDGIEPAQQAKEIVADTCFAVKRRSLI